MISLLAIVLSVASPLGSYSDYSFCTPVATGSIHGVVLGDSGGYASMRYEDIAFLTEAFAERVAIASTQGTLSFETVSDLAKSNNVVRPEIVKRSFPSALTYYIAPSNELITGPNAVYTSRSGM